MMLYSLCRMAIVNVFYINDRCSFYFIIHAMGICYAITHLALTCSFTPRVKRAVSFMRNHEANTPGLMGYLSDSYI